MEPKMPRRMAWRPTTTTAATRMLKLDMMNMICAAAARALFSSRWPMYWLAPTRLTPETAASPTEETIRVSARPMEMLRACSATSGRKSEMSC